MNIYWLYSILPEFQRSRFGRLATRSITSYQAWLKRYPVDLHERTSWLTRTFGIWHMVVNIILLNLTQGCHYSTWLLSLEVDTRLSSSLLACGSLLIYSRLSILTSKWRSTFTCLLLHWMGFMSIVVGWISPSCDKYELTSTSCCVIFLNCVFWRNFRTYIRRGSWTFVFSMTRISDYYSII